MVIYDFECFRHDWLVCWLDTDTRKIHSIVNDKPLLEKMYKHYKNTVWVGYNSRGYDQWILKAILCDFNPYEMSDWIINKEQKGFMFSNLLSKFPVMNYDCAVGFRGLKELEAFMSDDIRETEVDFNIDRPLTQEEIDMTLKYCKHDVMETFKVFVETKSEWESHIGLIKEFRLPWSMISKSKAQLSAEILGAEPRQWNDEFDIELPDNIILGKYEFLREHFLDWAANSKNYEEITLETDVAGVPHTFGAGGAHGAVPNYLGEGYYLMADVESYYPAGMIEYNFLSRNVRNPKKYRDIRDERLKMKIAKDLRQLPRKIVLNATFGASKDKYNKLYDPKQANNLCISCQLFIVDLIEKLEGKCELIQTNTDGILVKLFSPDDRDMIVNICHEWEKRTRFKLEFDEYRKVIQKDVNNYIILPSGELYDDKGKERFKRKGAYVKKLSKIDNDLPIVNRAIVNYFVHNKPVEETIMESTSLIDFQKITKISSKYEYGFLEDFKHGKPHDFVTVKYDKFACSYNEVKTYIGEIVNGKVQRCFASKLETDGILYKKKKDKTTLDKTGGTPEHCFIINDDISNMPIPSKLDRQWYIDLAKKRIDDFV